MCVMCLRRYCGRSLGLLSVAETIDIQFVDMSELANNTHNLLLKELNMNMIERIILTKVWKYKPIQLFISTWRGGLN